MHFIFLYSRFADYFYKSLLDLLSDNKRITAHIVRYQQDKNAPFVFDETNNLKLYNYDDFSSKNELLNFIIELGPKLIYVSGWSNKNYNYVVSKFYNQFPTIVGLDNPWEGKLRQYLGIFYYRIFMKSYFSHIWVAGKPHYKFARYLGFKQDKILNDLYRFLKK